MDFLQFRMEIVGTAIRKAFHINHYCNTIRRCYQQRFFRMSARKLEKEIDELKTNPYYEKYAEKIASLQQTSPEEFLSRIEQRSKERSKKRDAVKERFIV